MNIKIDKYDSLLVIAILTVSIFVGITVTAIVGTYPKRYECYQFTSPSDKGFVSATNCKYNDERSEYECDKGIYKYCNSFYE